MTDAPAPSLDAPSPVRDVTTADRPVAPDRVAPPPMCPSPRVPCGAVCVDLASDLSNCGSCGTVCPPGSPCESRVCGMPRPLVVVMVSEGLATMPDGPMRTGPLLSLRITFSLPVTGVTTGAFRLYLSGRSVSLRDMRISGSGAVWQLTLPSSLTNIRARYRIDIGGPMSTIRAGTLAMTAIHSVYWVRV